ncbi:MAG: response regulator transcription factor [Lachnospiraceae bacterium]|nr:response regulator transcription factor [Lachnospiraceae bacterium]
MNLYDYKILLVDDEETLRNMVSGFLQRAGFLHVTVAGSCREAEAQFAKVTPHLVLLDVMLPDGDGFSLLKRLRENSEVPVIFLSARDEDESRLRGLGLGADDYITKPFLPEELILRVTAVLKRVYRVKDVREEEAITLGSCLVDLGSGVVYRNRDGEDGGDETKADSVDAEVTLTAKEYAIIQKLAQERGRIVTIDALCDAVWQEGNFGYENTLVVHIRRLREKIEEDPSHPQHLLTVRGLGYRLV